MTKTPVKYNQAALPQLPRAIPFQLEDLKGQKQYFQFPRSRVLVLAFADQKGSQQMEAWITPLYQHFQERIEIQGIAELSAVPAFARGIARGIISGLVEQPILLDWSGQVAQSFGARSGVTHLFVISEQGEIIAEESGAFDLEALKRLARVIENL